MTYAEWIAREYPTSFSAWGACATATKRMIAFFPELKRVRGWVNGNEHWWCIEANGTIVDPTAHQWTPRPALSLYVPFVDGVHEEAIGMCMNCGSYCFASNPHATSNWCCEACGRAICSEYGCDYKAF